MNKFIAVGAALAFAGCATSGYKQFYHDLTGGKTLSELPVIVPAGEPRLVQGTDFKAMTQAMFEDGYGLLGYSTFNGSLEDPRNALTLARAIHAEVVIVYSSYSHTVNGVMPIVTPTSQTSYSTGSATAYGSNGGWANAYGSGTTTTYGSQTNFVPYSVARYDQHAQFWIKAKTPLLGVRVEDLSEEQRREIASNKGVKIVAVIKGTPAFAADFLKGDIIRRIDGHEVSYATQFTGMLPALAGKTIQIEGIRDGRDCPKVCVTGALVPALGAGDPVNSGPTPEFAPRRQFSAARGSEASPAYFAEIPSASSVWPGRAFFSESRPLERYSGFSSPS